MSFDICDGELISGIRSLNTDVNSFIFLELLEHTEEIPQN
jgi:hypothetical protein